MASTSLLVCRAHTASLSHSRRRASTSGSPSQDPATTPHHVCSPRTLRTLRTILNARRAARSSTLNFKGPNGSESGGRVRDWFGAPCAPLPFNVQLGISSAREHEARAEVSWTRRASPVYLRMSGARCARQLRSEALALVAVLSTCKRTRARVLAASHSVAKTSESKSETKEECITARAGAGART